MLPQAGAWEGERKIIGKCCSKGAEQLKNPATNKNGFLALIGMTTGTKYIHELSKQ